MSRFVNVERDYSEDITLCSLEEATHLISIEDEFSVEIDGMDFSEVKSYISKGYKPCIAKEFEKIVIEMDKKTAKHLMFLLGHFGSKNHSMFHPLVGTDVEGDTLYDSMANVLGDIFDLRDEDVEKISLRSSRSMFGDPTLNFERIEDEQE